MKKQLLLVFLSLMLLACGGARRNAVEQGAANVHESKRYAYRPTAATGTEFRYAQVSHDGKFEWKTLSLSIDNEAFYEGNTLVFVVDMQVENSGLRTFPWPDYSFYVALPDESGEWNYRMLFTQSDVQKVPPNKAMRFRYYTRLPGKELPDDIVLVSQSFFGGSDTGFRFYLPD